MLVLGPLPALCADTRPSFSAHWTQHYVLGRLLTHSGGPVATLCLVGAYLFAKQVTVTPWCGMSLGISPQVLQKCDQCPSLVLGLVSAACTVHQVRGGFLLCSTRPATQPAGECSELWGSQGQLRDTLLPYSPVDWPL